MPKLTVEIRPDETFQDKDFSIFDLYINGKKMPGFIHVHESGRVVLSGQEIELVPGRAPD